MTPRNLRRPSRLRKAIRAAVARLRIAVVADFSGVEATIATRGHRAVRTAAPHVTGSDDLDRLSHVEHVTHRDAFVGFARTRQEGPLHDALDEQDAHRQVPCSWE